MKVAWVSFDEIGRSCLIAAAEAGADVVAVVTLPRDREPKPSGWCAFDDVADRLGAPLIETDDVNDPGTIEKLAAASPEMTFVVGWSQLVREPFIRLAPEGVFGMHPTLLPRHRGRAPIPWAILSGLAKTGVSLFEIVDPTADSGALVGQVEVAIDPRETATSLFARIAEAHVELVRTCVPALLTRSAARLRQDPARASEWPKRRPRDGIIDWETRAPYLDAWVRALTHPYPGAFTFRGDQRVVIWQAREAEGTGTSGTVIRTGPDGAVVACGEGALLVERIEVEGLGVLEGDAIGELLSPGTVLG